MSLDPEAAFFALLRDLADAWDKRNADSAAALFSEQALYSQPGLTVRGREALRAHFAKGFDGGASMHIVWRHMSFCVASGVGAGEFSFYWPGGLAHGAVIARAARGKITNWREYVEFEERDWLDYWGDNAF